MKVFTTVLLFAGTAQANLFWQKAIDTHVEAKQDVSNIFSSPDVCPYELRPPVDSCQLSGRDLKKKLDKLLNPLMDAFNEKLDLGTSWAFHGIGNDNKKVTWSSATGYSNVNDNHKSNWEKMTTEHFIPSGSMTKPITAVTIMQMIAQNKTAVEMNIDGTDCVRDKHNECKSIPLKLHTPIYKFVNGLLKTNLNTTMQQRFPDEIGYNMNVNNTNGWGSAVTVEYLRNQHKTHLLSMTSCINDYDDDICMAYSFGCPELTLDPYWFVNEKFSMQDIYFPSGSNQWGEELPACELGAQKTRAYSGLNFVLLGLVLTHVQGLDDWSQLDQRVVIPKHHDHEMADGIVFGWKDETCAQMADRTGKDVVHQYVPVGNMENVDTDSCWTYDDDKKWPKKNQTFSLNTGMADLYEGSCLNGFTMGNSAMTPTWYSKMLWYLFNNDFDVPENLVSKMKPPSCHWDEDSPEWTAHGCGESSTLHRYAEGYGLGMQLLTLEKNINATNCSRGGSANVLGHAGIDYGSGGTVGWEGDGNWAFTSMYNFMYGLHADSWHKNVNGTCMCCGESHCNDADIYWMIDDMFDYFVNIIYNTCLDDEEHAQQWADKTREKIMSLTFDLNDGCNERVPVKESWKPEDRKANGYVCGAPWVEPCPNKLGDQCHGTIQTGPHAGKTLPNNDKCCGEGFKCKKLKKGYSVCLTTEL